MQQLLVNPAAARCFQSPLSAFPRPIFLAPGCVFLIHMLLPNRVFSAALSVATFFFVTVASDIELRAVEA